MHVTGHQTTTGIDFVEGRTSNIFCRNTKTNSYILRHVGLKLSKVCWLLKSVLFDIKFNKHSTDQYPIIGKYFSEFRTYNSFTGIKKSKDFLYIAICFAQIIKIALLSKQNVQLISNLSRTLQVKRYMNYPNSG